MSQTPLLSIVAAVYNGEKFLAQFFSPALDGCAAGPCLA